MMRAYMNRCLRATARLFDRGKVIAIEKAEREQHAREGEQQPRLGPRRDVRPDPDGRYRIRPPSEERRA